MAGRIPKDTAGTSAPDLAHLVPVSDQEYCKVISLLDSALQSLTITPDKTVQSMVLLQRSSCYAMLNDQDSVVSDSKKALKLLSDMKDVQTTVCYVKRCLILALYKKQKLSQAEDIVREWLKQLYHTTEDRKQPVAILERYLVIFQLSNSGGGGGKRPQQAILDAEMQQLDEKLNNWIRDSMPGDQLTENQFHPFRLTLDTSDKVKQLLLNSALKNIVTMAEATKGAGSSSSGGKTHNEEKRQSEETKTKKSNGKNKDPETFKCTYCAITFDTRSDLTMHCQSESHQIVIMSDEGKYCFHIVSGAIGLNNFTSLLGRDWSCRPPPRGYTADSYTLCESFLETGVCHYGAS